MKETSQTLKYLNQIAESNTYEIPVYNKLKKKLSKQTYPEAKKKKGKNPPSPKKNEQKNQQRKRTTAEDAPQT